VLMFVRALFMDWFEPGQTFISTTNERCPEGHRSHEWFQFREVVSRGPKLREQTTLMFDSARKAWRIVVRRRFALLKVLENDLLADDLLINTQFVGRHSTLAPSLIERISAIRGKPSGDRAEEGARS
jgi:hypothetical protein